LLAEERAGKRGLRQFFYSIKKEGDSRIFQAQDRAIDEARGGTDNSLVAGSKSAGERSLSFMLREPPAIDTMVRKPVGRGGAHSSPDRADALVWAFTELLVEEIASAGPTATNEWTVLFG
jgi:hypothetical protein